MFKLNFLLFQLIAIFPCNSKLNTIQQELIVALQKNINVHNLILIDDSPLSFPLDTNVLVKYLSKNSIFTRKLSTSEAAENLKPIFHTKILVLIDCSTKMESIRKLFTAKNEYFLSRYVWVVFDYGELEILDQVYIPYDCQFFLIKETSKNEFGIFEIYNVRINEEDVYTAYYGKLKENGNFEMTEVDFYQRRFDMNRTRLVVYNNYWPMKCLEPSAICSYMEITEEISRIMNFRIDYFNRSEIRKLMYYNPKTRYEIGICLSVCDSYSFHRYAVTPIWKTSTYLHIKYDASYYEQGHSSPYLKPFKRTVWISISFWIITSGICIFVINISIHYFIHCREICKFKFVDNLFYSFELYNSQFGSEFPKITSSRIASFMMQIIPRFIIPLYSAVVISYITVQVEHLPFTDLKGLVKDQSFSVGYLNETAVHLFFEQSNNPTVIASQKLLYDPQKMPVSPEEGAELICQNEKFAFVYFNYDLYDQDLPCEILRIPSPVYITWDCFILREFSSYQNIFNRLLKTFYSAGMIKRWEQQLFKKRILPTNDINPVKLEKLNKIYVAVVALYFLSLIFLIMECLHNWMKRKFLHNKQKDDILFIRRVLYE